MRKGGSNFIDNFIYDFIGNYNQQIKTTKGEKMEENKKDFQVKKLKEESQKNGEIGAALLKVALGCKVEEVTEEYSEVDGELKLLKRKKVHKDIPPDLKAVQMLLEKNGGDRVEKMSDEELTAEKNRLVALLKSDEKKEEEKRQRLAELKERYGKKRANQTTNTTTNQTTNTTKNITEEKNE